jgi:hypothetical protein
MRLPLEGNHHKKRFLSNRWQGHERQQSRLVSIQQQLGHREVLDDVFTEPKLHLRRGVELAGALAAALGVLPDEILVTAAEEPSLQTDDQPVPCGLPAERSLNGHSAGC